MIYDPVDRASEARRRLELWIAFLKLSFATHNSTSIGMLSELLGSACLATMAEVESFVRDLVESLVEEINACGRPIKDLRPTIRVLAAHTQFDSIKSMGLKNDKFWETRVAVTTLDVSDVIASLPVRSSRCPQPPLRGATIRPAQITEVAKIFGFPEPFSFMGQYNGSSLPVSLQKVAEYRNDFAHGGISSSELFSDPIDDVDEVVRHIGNIARFLDEVADGWKDVVSKRSYLRN